MMRARTGAVLLTLLIGPGAVAGEALPPAPRDPCASNPAHATADALDVALCQIALDAQSIARQADLQSQLNGLAARGALLKQDLDAALAANAALEAQKATLIEWLKAAQAPAR